MNLNNDYMSYNERQQIMSDINLYYKGSERWASILNNMPDHQLLAFRQSLTNTRKLNGKACRQIGIHINVIMNIYGASDYIIEEGQNNSNEIYIGRHINKNDKFGNPINIQYGYVIVDDNWKIIEVEMLGKRLTRYNGMRLNTSFNKFN